MRVLITGGAGFIGSHLVDWHLAQGDEVVVIDDFSTGSRHNLSHHRDRALTVVEGRVEDPRVLDEGFLRIDRVYHLAAAVGVFEILRRPLDSLRTNLDASEAIFERATREGVRTVFTSTSEVYGKNGQRALTEEDDSIYGPTTASRWLYAVSKATDEFLALAYHREHGFAVTIARLFNTTGPRQTGAYGMVVPRFVHQAWNTDPLTVFGSGTQTRCFTNVADVVRCLVGLADTQDAIGKVVNVGRPDEISINDLAALVRRIVGTDSPIIHLPYARAYEPGFEDMRRRVPDVGRLRELIGYVPATPIEQTVAEMVAAMKAGDETSSRFAAAVPQVVPAEKEPDGPVVAPAARER
jgi:UDP-glucose 4-epimerase